jgi:hypothetical protein
MRNFSLVPLLAALAFVLIFGAPRGARAQVASTLVWPPAAYLAAYESRLAEARALALAPAPAEAPAPLHVAGRIRVSSVTHVIDGSYEVLAEQLSGLVKPDDAPEPNPRRMPAIRFHFRDDAMLEQLRPGRVFRLNFEPLDD